MSGDSRDCQFTGIDRSDCSRVQQTVWKIRESQLDVAILARPSPPNPSQTWRVYAARLSAVTMGPICNFYHSRKSRFRHARQEPTIAMFYFVCYFFFTITASAVGGDPARGLGTLAHSGEDSLRNSASDAGAVDSDKWKVQ